jgi:phosphonate transport system permease protein
VSPAGAEATRGRTSWTPLPLIRDYRLRWALTLGALLYLVLALNSVEVNWQRVIDGADRGLRFISAFLQPNFTGRFDEIVEGVIESLTMTVTSTVIGVLLSIPVAVGAARNVAPLPVYLFCRGIISISRTFPEIIIAILFVKMFGFGTLAGMVTLIFATVGFMAKLLAEDIEDVDVAPVEAVRATGASWLQMLNYAIQPQVMPRLVGLAVYRFDINFRESAIIGIVGAGGIGATLNTAFDRYEYDTAAAVLLIIIMIVMMAEYASGVIRRRLQ